MRVALGCVNLGSAGTSRSSGDQIRVVRSAIDRGVTTFDTADAYANGTSERLLGRAIKGRRDDVVIATKGGYRFRSRSGVEQWARAKAGQVVQLARDRRPQPASGRDWSARSASGGYTDQDFSPSHLRSAVEASLRRLGTDHLDVYHLHGPAEVDDDLLAELDDLRQAGTVLAFGIGAESVAAAADWVPVPEVDNLFIPFGVLDPEDSGLLDAAAERRCGVWVRGVLGGGVLAAAARSLDEIAGHPKRATVTELVAIAEAAGIGIDELAIRWLDDHPQIGTVVIGIGSSAHLERNLGIVDKGPLDRDVRQAIDRCLATTLPTEER